MHDKFRARVESNVQHHGVVSPHGHAHIFPTKLRGSNMRLCVLCIITWPPSRKRADLTRSPTSNLPETTPPTAQSDVRQYSRTFLLWAMFSAEKTCLQFSSAMRTVPHTQGGAGRQEVAGGEGAARGIGAGSSYNVISATCVQQYR